MKYALEDKTTEDRNQATIRHGERIWTAKTSAILRKVDARSFRTLDTTSRRSASRFEWPEWITFVKSVVNPLNVVGTCSRMWGTCAGDHSDDLHGRVSERMSYGHSACSLLCPSRPQ